MSTGQKDESSHGSHGSSGLLDARMVHIIGEISILLCTIFYFSRQNGKMFTLIQEQEKKIEELTTLLQKSENNFRGIFQKLQSHENAINILGNNFQEFTKETSRENTMQKRKPLHSKPLLKKEGPDEITRTHRVKFKGAKEVEEVENIPPRPAPPTVEPLVAETSPEEVDEEVNLEDVEEEEISDSELDDEINAELLSMNRGLKK